MYNPSDRDEEAGLGSPVNLIEEPLEGAPESRKDVEVRDGSGGSSSRILVQRLASIPSFGRDIPVVRIVSDETQPSTSGSYQKDPESLVEIGKVNHEDDDDDDQGQQMPSTSSSGGASESAEAAALGHQNGGGSGSGEKTFKRPDISELKLPSSPYLDRPSSSGQQDRDQQQQPEQQESGGGGGGDEDSDDEDEKMLSAEEAMLASPMLAGRTKARLQEPAPITPGIKDQIADSLHLKRSMTMAPVPEEERGVGAAAGDQQQLQPVMKPIGSFKQPMAAGTPTGAVVSPGVAMAKQPSNVVAAPNPDEDDPLEDQIIPEYKEKLKRDESLIWVMSQWVCLVLLVALLICSIRIKAVRDITWLGNNIWRWQAVALVIFSGRLIAGWVVLAFVLLIEKRFLLRKRVLYFVYGLRKSVKNCIWLALVITIWETVFIERHNQTLKVITRILWCLFTICLSWMLKVLAVKVAANGFHRAAYFERIQDCLFNQYLLATLSAPPTMHLAADPSGGEELITSRYNPNELQKQQTGPRDAFEAPFPSPRLQAPIIARSANPIEQDKLQQLTSENVSAWTLKSLMKLIRKKNLASYTSQFSKEDEWQIDSEVRAKAAAKQIFYNIARPGRKYLMLRDFLYFLPEDKATRAFRLFETNEHGNVTRKAFVKWVVTVYKERRALALTLNDNKTVVAKLHRVLNAVLGIGLIIVSLLILGVETAKLLVFFSSIFIPCVFIFGNAAKTTFEALIFLFVLHPYDVGDRVNIDGTMMLVEEMNVLNTVFLGPTNEKIYYPNAILGNKFITNYYRSPDQWDGIEFQIHMNTPLEKLGVLKERMQRYIDSQPQFWYPDFGLMCKDIDDCNKMKMGYFFQHHLNYQEAGERFKRRSNMMLYMKQQLEDLGITYQLPSQEVIVTGIPAFSFPAQSSPKSSPGKSSPTSFRP